MKHTLTFLALTLCLLTGCAQVGTRQIDRNETTRYDLDKKGQTNAITTEVRQTSTRAKGTAFVTGQTALRGFEANQDGDSQGLKIKESSQKTDAMRDMVESLRLIRDLGGMAYGIPPSQSVQPASLPQPPAGQKWILVPKDDPSTPQPEQ